MGGSGRAKTNIRRPPPGSECFVMEMHLCHPNPNLNPGSNPTTEDDLFAQMDILGQSWTETEKRRTEKGQMQRQKQKNKKGGTRDKKTNSLTIRMRGWPW